MIIAIDGPAGAGKSTVARLLAKKMGFLYIDTGAMYRAITLKALDSNMDLKKEVKLIQLLEESSIDLKNNPDGTLEVYLDGKNVSKQIRTPRISQFVSDIAKIKGIRKIMLKLQRGLGKRQSAVLEGRDIGTVVFPDADKKFYLDAKFQERVTRRYKELDQLGERVSENSVHQDLERRDKIDSSRDFAPLKKAEDAVRIDTTKMTIEQVVDRIFKDISPARTRQQSSPAEQKSKNE